MYIYTQQHKLLLLQRLLLQLTNLALLLRLRQRHQEMSQKKGLCRAAWESRRERENILGLQQNIFS